jgi:hypothetical protein
MTHGPRDPPAVLQVDGDVLIQGAWAVGVMYRATLALVARRHLDGLSSHDLQELRTALYRGAVSAS